MKGAGEREVAGEAAQAEVLGFLGEPESHGLTEPIGRIDTHGAIVFVAGDTVYKVKRAVRFSFMDFSTLEKRRAACEAEIAINTPNAPTVYLGAVTITREGTSFAIGGDGEPVEWAVRMRRFDEALRLDHLAGSPLAPALIARLARAVLASHERAPRGDGEAATAALGRYIADNQEAFAQAPTLFDPAQAAMLTGVAQAALEEVTPSLLARGRAGFVRRCHGDLHMRNVVVLDGEPTLFDAIDFDAAIATGDVLYDLAFMLMDLWTADQAAATNLLLNRYLWESDEANLAGLAGLPLFLSLRAALRAKVTAASLPHLAGEARAAAEHEARKYFLAAVAFLQPQPVALVAIGGLSGSGKSTVAAALAPAIGRAPGAVHLRSDIERKRLFGVAETFRLPESAYTEEATARVYAVLRRKAASALAAGQAVIVDAVHAQPAEREAVEVVAREAGVAFVGLWLDAATTERVARVGLRRGDASDADAAVAAGQSDFEVGAIDWQCVDAGGELAETVRAAQGHLAEITQASNAGVQSSMRPKSQSGAA